MHDIRAIRENPDAYAAALSRRPTVDGKSEIARIMELDGVVRAAILKKQEAEQARNAKSKEIGKAKASKHEALAASLMADVAAAKATIEAAGKEEADATNARDDLLARLPNIPLEDVPAGEDEHGNVVVRRKGEPRQFDFKPKDHADLGEALGMMDFEAASRMSGARFVVLKGQLARLERALTQFMLDIQTVENGYTEHVTPLMVRQHAMFGTGQLPKFEEDLFRIGGPPEKALEALNLAAKQFDVQKYRSVAANLAALFEHAAASANEAEAAGHDSSWFDSTLKAAAEAASKLEGSENELEMVQSLYAEKLGQLRAQQQEVKYLIPTAEVSLTNIYREQIVDASILPVRMTAATPCFRSEAGSAGRDTKGMIRQHQFTKVELVSVTAPEDSEAEHERMTRCAEMILERLELPYRTMMLCTGDMGFGARKTYDLEVWLPSQDTYREISSCSNCGDFQARRMDGKFRRGQGEKPEYFHTLNGSGLAVGRTLVAVLENYQRANGQVDVPKALQPYMAGLEVIG